MIVIVAAWLAYSLIVQRFSKFLEIMYELNIMIRTVRAAYTQFPFVCVHEIESWADQTHMHPHKINTEKYDGSIYLNWVETATGN